MSSMFKKNMKNWLQFSRYAPSFTGWNPGSAKTSLFDRREDRIAYMVRKKAWHILWKGVPGFKYWNMKL